MKPFKRTQRINKEIQRLLSESIRAEVMDPRVNGVVVTEVVVSPDFSVAKVYVQSMMGEAAKAVDGLNGAKGFLRTSLSTGIRSKKVPKLTFFVDETSERLEQIESLFEEIHRND